MKTALKLFIFLTLIVGVLYPLAITMLGSFLNTRGDIVYRNGIPVGAKMIAQKFEQEKYFWPRPSFNDYNSLASGGSNLSLTSAVLAKIVTERKNKFATNEEIPSELLYASGSGLDPHITMTTAKFQIERISKARSISKEKIEILLDKEKIKPILGEPYINVLQTNLELDKLD